jgi:hypothetical protein
MHSLIQKELLSIQSYLQYPVYLSGSYFTNEAYPPFSDIDFKIYHPLPTSILYPIFLYTHVTPYILQLDKHLTQERIYIYVFEYKKYEQRFQICVKSLEQQSIDQQDESNRNYLTQFYPFSKYKHDFLQHKSIYYHSLQYTPSILHPFIKKIYYKHKNKYFQYFRQNESENNRTLQNLGYLSEKELQSFSRISGLV